MAEKILFDADGVIGPSITLMLQINTLSDEEVVIIGSILVENFVKLSGNKIGTNNFSKKNFNKEDIQMNDVINSPLFQSMQNEYSIDITKKVLDKITPKTIAYISKYLPHIDFNESQYDELKLWFSKQLQTYMTENQIVETCNVADVDPQHIKRRQEIGMEIYNCPLTIEEFDVLIESLTKLDLPENSSNYVIEFFNKYKDLFEIVNNDSFKLNIINLLNTIFRRKKFPI